MFPNLKIQKGKQFVFLLAKACSCQIMTVTLLLASVAISRALCSEDITTMEQLMAENLLLNDKIKCLNESFYLGKSRMLKQAETIVTEVVDQAQVIITSIDATFKMKEQEWIQRINALESELAWAKTELFVVQTNCHEVITRMKDKEIMLLDEIRRLSHLCWMNQKLSTIPRTHVVLVKDGIAPSSNDKTSAN